MYKIATRGSQLALSQSGIIRDQLRQRSGFEAELQIVKTEGDRIKDIPLSQVAGAGFFTKEIEQALIDLKADIAVHSLKDLPLEQPHALRIAAIPERENFQEALITKREKIDRDKPLYLKQGLTIGTSAIRRQAQIRSLRPDLEVRELRGNITTRLDKLRRGEYDAIMIAHAGLLRLGIDIDDLEKIVLDIEMIIPSPAQGALAVETRSADLEVYEAVVRLNHIETQMAVWAERNLLQLCGGGCHLPLGAIVTQSDEGWDLTAYWSFQLPDKSTESVKVGASSPNLHDLIRDGFAQIKSREMNARLEFSGHDRNSKRRLLITRSSQKSQPLISKLAVRDVETIACPVNKLVPLENPSGWDEIKGRLSDYDILIFTSANAVSIFIEQLSDENIDLKFARDMLIAVVGEKTAMEAVRFEAKKVIVSPVATGVGLANHLKASYAMKPLRALFPVSRKAPTKIQQILEDSGWQVDRLEIYDSLPEKKENLPEIDPSKINYACFTSPLTVEYLNAYIDIPDNWILISIGPSTSEKLKECGLRVDWELPNSNLEWLWQVL